MSAEQKGHKTTQEERERVAQEKFGTSYENLDTSQKRSVAGTIGGEHRKEQLGPEGYSEMGHKGGEHGHKGGEHHKRSE